ncbi:MAG: Fic family protein [Actinomyces sp.]|nr:MAG: Fic family protein [Actinomyces sp.]
MPTDLSNSPVGTTVVIRGTDSRFGAPYELEAFVPHPLPRDPRELDLSGPVWTALSDAMAAVGRLDSAATRIPNPGLVTRVATRREAIGTSALEGTFADLTELFAAEAVSGDEANQSTPPNIREVMNYTRAAEAAYDWVRTRPITMPLLSSLQAAIVRGTDSDGPAAGALRDCQVFIGARNRPITEARFIPPPPGDQLRVLLEDWLDWINDPSLRDSLPLVARVALAHYQFEAIHPFTDGNGRLGRLIAVLQMLRDGALTAPVLSVSDWLKDHASEYRDHLLGVSVTGDWGPWVEFFTRAVARSAEDTYHKVISLLDLREELVSRARAELPRARLAIEIAEDLIAFPVLSVASAQARHGRSNQANRNAINRLCELGLLEPYGDARYGRLYWNRRVFEIIES